MNRLIVKTLMMIGLLLLVPAHAGVYKWVDPQGNVHYTQHPPADASIKAREINKPPPPPEDIVDVNEPFRLEIEAKSKNQKVREEAEAKKRAKQTRDVKDAEKCERARSNLAVLQTGGAGRGSGASFVNEAGERIKMDDEQRAERLKQAQKQVEYYCED
ncbi:MAG: DUF4124 domain-containing protein [Gammaproteobacteria bacterium]|nr:MAG: DUF4124 domain-containing protein [Gammaproteobacteria bacterium]